MTSPVWCARLLMGRAVPLSAVIAIAFALAAPRTSSAQMRVESITVRRAASGDTADAPDRQLRRMQRELDSLTQLYFDDQQMTAAARRHIGDGLERAAARLEALSGRVGAPPRARSARVVDVYVPMAPMLPAQASAQMSRALTQWQAAQAAMPRGWMGIVAEGAGGEPRLQRGELMIRYLSYPRIVSVDPSSPAQRAGLESGDTLLAYNALDLRENEISLTRLLRPNARVVVRVLRDARVRDFAVTVAPVPPRIEVRRGNEMHEARAPWTVVGVPDAPAFAPRAAPRPDVARQAPAMGSLPMLPAVAMSDITSFANGVAGAQLLTITEGLGRTLGVRDGVLVLAAPMGSPAQESGLLDGDVIRKVAGQAVRTVSQMRELIAQAVENGDRTVELETLRDRRGRRVVLRW